MLKVLRISKSLRTPISNKSASISNICLSEEVKRALANKQPVVALESTIISHGMPYPRNLEVAMQIEQTVRDNGATPATIAIIDGVPKIGLSGQELQRLAKNDGSIWKASTRDLGYVCANKLSAATTVASTMKLASLAGISVFATGGIGGVHRGAELSMDVSADLVELSRSPVTVVCSGIKSILDIAKSLEVLETHGVPVLGFNTVQFPAFFTNDSGIKTPMVVTSAATVAEIMANNRLLSLNCGVVLAVPNPSPANADKINYAIDFALVSAADEGVTGSALTPYLLSKIQHLTGGDSLDSNIALVLNNAKIASLVAREYASVVASCSSGDEYSRLASVSDSVGSSGTTHSVPAEAAVTPVPPTQPVQQSKPVQFSAPVTQPVPTPVSTPVGSRNPHHEDNFGQQKVNHDVVVVGGAVVDIVGNITTHSRMHTSNPGHIRTTHGGVGRNIAESLSMLGVDVALLTAVGEDEHGKSLLNRTRGLGINVSHCKVVSREPIPSIAGSETSSAAAASAVQSADSHHSTAVYNAIHDQTGELCIGIADMSIFSQITPEFISSLVPVISASKLVVSDGNIPAASFKRLAEVCREHKVALFFEPTSDHKCLLPFQADCMDQVDIIKPNVSELIQLVNHCLSQNLITRGKATVANTVSQIVANRMSSAHSMDDVDLVDVRILANALHAVISARDESFSPASKNKIVGKRKAVSGKHVIVSMGKRGVLWCGPTQAVATPQAKQETKQSGVLVEDQNGCSSCFLPTEAFVEGTAVLHTNGAGDAMCGGILAELVLKLTKQAAAGEATSGKPNAPVYLPDIDCIKSGMSNARNWILSRK